MSIGKRIFKVNLKVERKGVQLELNEMSVTGQLYKATNHQHSTAEGMSGSGIPGHSYRSPRKLNCRGEVEVDQTSRTLSSSPRPVGKS